MKELALTLPGGQTVTAPGNAPSGGLATTGKSIVMTGINILLLVAIVLALFYLIYGGFQWMTSGGDQEKITGSRQTIIYAVIGLGVTALSFLIIQVVGHVLGIPNALNIDLTFK